MTTKNPPEPSHIAIIGAGFSGTLVAAHLLHGAKSPLTVHLIERHPRQFARGVAYGTAVDCHLLNVPAGKMSAFPGDPEHFLRWAGTRKDRLLDLPCVDEVSPGAFLPRRAYGEYLGEVLEEAERSAAPEVHLQRHGDEAVGITVEAGGVVLRLGGGTTLRVRRAVLALGNFPPGNPAVEDPSFYQSTRYYPDPWAPGLLESLLKTESCLLVGSGLTMVDWAVTLNRSGYAGTIHVVSRRGLWPKAHQPAPAGTFTLDPHGQPPSVRAWLHRVRRHIRSSGEDWRSVIDALRPNSQALWRSLPLVEQQRFLRHLRPYWDCHRHRLAPLVAERLEALAETGRVVRQVGRVLGYRETGREVEVSIRRRGRGEVDTLRVAAVVNCSGSESNYRKVQTPLVLDLLDHGLALPDPLALGLVVGPKGALIGADGAASRYLFTLGPPQKGLLWETTAVPELRGQAARLAAALLESLHPISDR